MIQVTLWSFDKRRNSTKQPSTAGTTYEGELKSAFSVSGFELKLNMTNQLVAPVYNYAYIESFRRYYFITDWYYDSGFWYAVLAVDVLASYKSEIGGSLQFVTRSYSDYNSLIIDASYPTTGEISRSGDSITPASFWGANPTGANGLIVIGVVGASASGIGAVTYYAMSMAVFNAFMNSMLSSISWANISTSEISEELQKALINPTQYITFCRWFPIDAGSFTQGGATTTLSLGWWTFNLTGTARVLNTVGSAWVNRNNEMDIPKHPQHTGRGLFTEFSPYSSYMLKFLPFGVFEIDSTELAEKDTLGIQVSCNLMTGDAVLHLSAKKTTDAAYNWASPFLIAEAQIGVPLPIGQVSANMGNFKNALIAGAVSGIDALAAKFSG